MFTFGFLVRMELIQTKGSFLMTHSLPSSTENQHYEFELALTDGEVDFSQASTEDLTRLIAVCLGILADRRVSERE